MTPLEIAPVVRAYPQLEPRQCEPLGNGGGFSGARLWRIATSSGEFCLRRWPQEHPGDARLAYIHSVLVAVHARGVREVALPLPSAGGATFVRYDGYLWELTPWAVGRADFHQEPRPARLRSALAWLAKFHLAAAPPQPQFGPSPGIAERLALLRRLRAGDADEISRRLPSLAWPDFTQRAKRILTAFHRDADHVESLLAGSEKLAVPLQPCIRDIWHDHLFFEGDRVSGVVDFGAMRVECVSSDVARLLGSLVGDDAEARSLGLEAYRNLRPLTDAEVRLLPVFDASGLLLSGMNWLRWICLEDRRFEAPELVLVRLEEIVQRLDRPRRLVVE